AAAGTLFSTAAPTLAGNAETALITVASLPPGSASLYDDGTNSSVAILPFGAGKIVLLGWDWAFSDPPFPGEQNGGWFPRVRRAAGPPPARGRPSTRRGRSASPCPGRARAAGPSTGSRPGSMRPSPAGPRAWPTIREAPRSR